MCQKISWETLAEEFENCPQMTYEDFVRLHDEITSAIRNCQPDQTDLLLQYMENLINLHRLAFACKRSENFPISLLVSSYESWLDYFRNILCISLPDTCKSVVEIPENCRPGIRSLVNKFMSIHQQAPGNKSILSNRLLRHKTA